MYYSDHGLYNEACNRQLEMLNAAEELRLASLFRQKTTGKKVQTLKTQLGVFLVGLGTKLQEE